MTGGVMNRRGTIRMVKGALILAALLLVLFPPSSLGGSVTRISAGILFLAAGFFFFLGMDELLSTISLSRRLLLTFFSIVLLWGLTGYAGSAGGVSSFPEDPERAERVLELGRRIDNVAQVGGGQVRSFVDSTFTGQTSEFLGTLGEVTGAATGVLINAVLTSTSVDTSGTEPEREEGRTSGSPAERVPPVRLAILAVSLVLLAAVRGFVFVDRSPATIWLYRATVALVFLNGFLHITGMRITVASASELFTGIELELPGLLLLVSSVSLGFCQRWVQYLSRKSRYIVLFGAFAAVIMIRGVYYWLSGWRCPGTGGLETAAVTVSAVYVLLAFLTMLLQLPTARILEKKSRELATLQDLSQVLHSSFELDQLCEAAVRLGVKLTGADACWFHLFSGRDHSHSRTGALEDIGDKLAPGWYSGVARRIDASGGGFMMNNYRRSSLRKMEDQSKGNTRIASLVAAPVEVRGERLGIILAASSRQFFFQEYTRGLFESFTRQIAQAVQSARLFGEKLQSESLARELELARDMQRKLLPGTLIKPAGWDISAVNIPSRVMGGDYYDVIPLEDGRTAVAVADVSGKGAPAAMLMAALQASLGTLLRENLAVDETVSRLNAALCGRMPDDTFITFFLGFIDPLEGSFQYCCAGHDPPLICHGNEEGDIEVLDRGGLILGVIPDASYVKGDAVIRPGSRLLLYTDGITESMSPEGEPFGVRRLRGFLAKHCSDSASGIIDSLTGLLESYREDGDQQDDVTALVVVRLAEGEGECPSTGR
ncbi:MAG TPA: SpoIIE family protein phosphatase [Candidatus Sabulitectum sp.]|nr:SpoIIE family protein phosphatase [Candidatus Sabulitectum sp.]